MRSASGAQPPLRVELLVEEPSAAAALEQLVPRILGTGTVLAIHAHQGKRDLLASLPGRLRGYARWLDHVHAHVVVLVDRDGDDCRQLKLRLESAAQEAGLVTRSAARVGAASAVVNRVAVEELEAWFFGDIPALCAAFPGVPEALAARKAYRDPDAIAGGTWEARQRVLQAAGYYSTGLNKIDAARRIASHMDPARNRSRSFLAFRDALRGIGSGRHGA